MSQEQKHREKGVVDEMQMQYSKTSRGFAIVRFVDRNGEGCTLQKSSIATEDAIWLGVAFANPKILIKNRGWVEYPIPEDVLLNTRMHLTVEHVAQLIPILQRFVDTGELPAGKVIEVCCERCGEYYELDEGDAGDDTQFFCCKSERCIP